MSQHQYDEQFYRYINRGALDSAAVVLPLVKQLFPVSSVLDVGCGAGAWLSVWKQQGASVLGLDGDYVDRASLLVDEAEFQATDISLGFDLERRVDLVQCLEVAEHLPAERAEEFVASLCRHADVVLFSAAPPGQGGENHVNERPYAYWRALFDGCGFEIYDALRPSLSGDDRVMPWYRYNMFLFARRGSEPALHERLADCAIDRDGEPVDVSPALYRIRKRLVALLPVALMTSLAVVKKHLSPRLPGTGQ